MPEAEYCSHCGAPLAAGPLAGLCPACLLQMGAHPDTVTDAKQTPFTPPPIAELAPLFPQLEILELLGKGGMGAVYKARQKQLDRIVALKILPPGIGGDSTFAERFTREAKALARLNHPGIVTLYEFGNVSTTAADPATPAAPLYYFLMEFVDGVNLLQLLATRRLAPRETLAIIPQICDALQFAHDQGIVHRDIKPENILMDRRGRVKVADFGLARIIKPGESDESGATNPAAAPAPDFTTGVMGTPQYMSPEQIHAPGEVDHRADIYALGVVFYQILTGELPAKPIAPPSGKVQIDVRLDAVVLRALEKNPELRYQQAGEIKTVVETIAATGGTAAVAEGAAADDSGKRGFLVACSVLAGLAVVVLLLTVMLSSPVRERLKAAWRSLQQKQTLPGLVARWSAEGSANDSVGGNDGTLVGGVDFTPGRTGKAFNFNGKDSYVTVPSSPAVKMTGPFSIEGWVKYTRTSGIGDDNALVLIAKGVDAYRTIDWALGISRTQKLRCHAQLGISWYILDCATTLNFGVWHHVAMVYDGSYLQGYVNGALDGKGRVIGILKATDEPLKLGAYAAGVTAGLFPGTLDEVSLYNRALSAEEIQAIYKASSPVDSTLPKVPDKVDSKK